MKKLSLLSIAALFVATTFTSCKKDYTCECTDKIDNTVDKFEYKKVKKADAEDACNTTSALYSIGGGSCTLN
jgi:hypothetical protein